jgi:MoaA/NifB/PqqE/SkfB family radical SAM enzyme
METVDGVKDPPFLRNAGLLLTYYCQASCAHCILRAGPNRHEQAELEEARNWVREIAAYRDHYVYVLSLTGGEPFSDLPLLRAVMEQAVESKLHVSLVSNAFWATTRTAAIQVLRSLPRICFLSLSTDVYHQKFVPFENVKNAMWALQECGIPFYITLVTDNPDDPDYHRVYAEVVTLVGEDNVRTGITFPVGRAALMSSKLKFHLTPTPPREACQAASSPCIFPDGRVFGCIGPLIDLHNQHPLLLGNVRETPLSEIFNRAETNVILHALRLWGPGRLISMLREAGLSQHLPEQYVAGSTCHACYRLMSNATIRDWLSHLEHDAAFKQKVAYGRLHYLEESGMLELDEF